MTTSHIPLAREIGRVPSSRVPLDAGQEVRYQRLAEEAVMIDVHQHPMILPEDVSRLTEYLRGNIYGWGYEAVRQGGWTAVTTANMFRCLVNNPDMSFAEFDDILTEVGLMLSDVDRQEDVVKVTSAAEIEAARQEGKVGFMPTLEHLAIGNDINRLDILYSAGVRLAGLTYNRKNYIGDGQQERNAGGLSEFGVEVVTPDEPAGDVHRRVARVHPHCHGRHRVFGGAHNVQPQRFLHPAAHCAYPTGRGTGGLRQERWPGGHNRRAQLR